MQMADRQQNFRSSFWVSIMHKSIVIEGGWALTFIQGLPWGRLGAEGWASTSYTAEPVASGDPPSLPDFLSHPPILRAPTLSVYLLSCFLVEAYRLCAIRSYKHKT